MVWIPVMASLLAVSLLSLLGVFTLALKRKSLKAMLIYLVSFSVGALLADVFIHLLPEIVEETGGFSLQISAWILLGVIVFFVIEKVIHWRHCHLPVSDDHHHPFALMNLFGDAVHNFIDGIIIAASYLVSIPVGVATTIAVALHEIPQEIADFGVLLHGGFSTRKALFFNFLTAATAILGGALALLLSTVVVDITHYLIPLAAGGFIYIAGSDLIPELHKEVKVGRSVLQLISLIMGVLVIASLLGLE